MKIKIEYTGTPLNGCPGFHITKYIDGEIVGHPNNIMREIENIILFHYNRPFKITLEVGED